MWMLTIVAAAWADCTLPDLEQQIAEARATLDRGPLPRADRVALEEQLACTTDLVPPIVASRLHTVLGLDHHRSGHARDAAAHFLGAWETDTFWELPALVADDPTARRAYEARQEARFQEGRPTQRLPQGLRVDGLPSRWRPADQPALVQYEAGGAFVLHPGERPPRRPPGARTGPPVARIAGLAALAAGVGTLAATAVVPADPSGANGPTLRQGLSVATAGLLGGGIVAISVTSR